ncbi:MAG: oxidoreductase-like domain-containing protein [Pseudomonadota bacterium]
MYPHEPAAASPADDPPPTEPVPPGDDACCGNGCDPCVWDFYQAEREQYLQALRAWRARQAQRELGTG